MASNSPPTEPSSNNNSNNDQNDVFSEENLQNYDINYFRLKLWQAAEIGDSKQFVETLRLIAKKILGSDQYTLQPLIIGQKSVNASQTSQTTTTTNNNKGSNNPPINSPEAHAQFSTILFQRHASDDNDNDDNSNDQSSNVNDINDQYHSKISDQNLSHTNEVGYAKQSLDSNKSQAANNQVHTEQSGHQTSAISQQQISNDNASGERKNDNDRVNSNTTNDEDQGDKTQQSNSNQLSQNNCKPNGKLQQLLDYHLKHNYFPVYFIVCIIYEKLMILIYVYAYIVGQELEATEKNSSSPQKLTEQADQTLSTPKKESNSQDATVHHQNSHSTTDISKATANPNDISLCIQDDTEKGDKSTKDTQDRSSCTAIKDQTEIEESSHNLDDKVNDKSLENGNKQAKEIESEEMNKNQDITSITISNTSNDDQAAHSVSSEAVRDVSNTTNANTSASDRLNLQTNATKSDKTQQVPLSNTNTTISNDDDLLPNKTNKENKSLEANTNINTNVSNVTTLQREAIQDKKTEQTLDVNASAATPNNITGGDDDKNKTNLYITTTVKNDQNTNSSNNTTVEAASEKSNWEYAQSMVSKQYIRML